MNGTGLLKGLAITFKELWKKPVTLQYPEQRETLPSRFHGSFTLHSEKCIACGLCQQACPNKVIKVGSVKDENNKRKLASYEMEMKYCLFCGLCVEACPTNAIVFNQEYELAKYKLEDVKLTLFKKEELTTGEGSENV
ncbi:NuoI/complex I 23 kDa subunit family protein [Carboxydothermus pertinax]|uniref:NADH-quinone oxidoreductase subunit I n=1 Tax=Carboxydothermus pertinax TaxID=870242 RepID=A0A1L8CXN4_9THEO|nr:NADH-quinone oxidoreductase subunit I [Carboxydothermus pertinax]GAV23663.1 NADH-quinone oxidoreductase subunit I [Carboxydothermus pertinax]